MPNSYTATGRRLELRDPINNHEKYYRIFTVEGAPFTLLNWGRIGTEGQWQIKTGTMIARDQYREKLMGGYQSVLPDGQDILSFEIGPDLHADLQRAFVNGERKSNAYLRLVSAFVANMGTYGKVEVARKTGAELKADMLANLLAKRDKYKAILNPEAAVVPAEPAEPDVPTIDPNSMQGRLAAALAEAEAKARS